LITRILLISLVLLSSLAWARVEFEITPFSAQDFRDAQRLAELCAQDATSFWCLQQGAELTLLTTKGYDAVFNAAGEIVALFAKGLQRGQDFGGAYYLDGHVNLIPMRAVLPGLALLINEEYLVPEQPTGAWQRLDENTYRGVFSYRLGDYLVEREVRVYANRIAMDLSLTVRYQGEEPREAPVQLAVAVPGIAREAAPVIKIGQAGSFWANPLPQPIVNPDYISFQSNDHNTGYALILRPALGLAGELAALSLPPGRIAMTRTLPPEAEAARFELQFYGGPNELIRFHQEGLLALPGLFRPNLMGQLSLGIVWVLEAIHQVVGGWGLSIIVLTLLFRVLVWPLITVQTRSMVGMQQLQPKLQALQKKYKDNREKLTQETMKLYQEAGVNPAAGCLPIFLQMPIFIILWRIFTNFEFGEGFLWIPDLGLPDPFFILPILYVGVMVGQAYIMAKDNPQSFRMQLMISLVFVFFIFAFPAGVTLYWVVSMLVQVGQHYLIQRSVAAQAAAT